MYMYLPVYVVPLLDLIYVAMLLCYCQPHEVAPETTVATYLYIKTSIRSYEPGIDLNASETPIRNSRLVWVFN